MSKQNRYPGIRPFSAEDNRLFFGRSESIKRINRLFKLEKLIVLFGKSGLGKTSLVQAGAIPVLQQEDLADGVEDFRFELVRFGAYHAGDSGEQGLTSETPIQKIRRAIAGNQDLQSSPLFQIVEDDQSPWMAAKALQLKGDARTIVLVLDQSEELFTWPQEEIDLVKDALQSLLNQNVPDSIRRKLHGAARDGELDYNQLMSPPLAKAMLIIRSDKLDGLDQLADVLPDIYNKRYELPPLDRTAATEAIEEPARLAGEFSTPNFSYSKDCLQYILDFLSNFSGESNAAKGGGKFQEKIEGFQLQLICQHAEFCVKEKVKAGETDIVLEKHDIGDLKEVTRSYYQRVLNGIGNPEERDKVQVLVEEGLIYEAGPDSRRLSLFDGLIDSQYGVGQEKLEYLGNSRLLRRVALPEGGFSYEISHDSLLAPILAVKEVRKGVEEKAAEEAAAMLALQEQQERDAALAKERQRKRTAMYLAVVSVLSILALGGMGFAFWQSNRASQQEEIALNEAKKAETARKQAVTEKAIADSLRARSDTKSKELEEQTMALNQLTIELQVANNLARLETSRANEEREKSANINRKLFSSALVQKYPWLKDLELEGLDLPAYETHLYPEWGENGNKMGDSLTLSDESMARLARVGEIENISRNSPGVALHLTYALLNSDESDLSIPWANTLLKRGVYTVSPRNEFSEIFYGGFIEYVEDPKKEIEYALGSEIGKIILLDSALERVRYEKIKHHDQNVTCIAFSDDGRFMATGSQDFHVKVYDRDNDYQLLSDIIYGQDWVRDITFSKDGLSLYVVGDVYKLKVYNLIDNPANQREVSSSADQPSQVFKYQAEYGGYQSYIRSVDLSEDESQIVTGGEYGELFLWQKAGANWVLEGDTMLDESILDIHFAGDNIRGILANGDMMEVHPSMESGSMVFNPSYISLLEPDSYYQPRWGIGEERGDEILFSPGNYKIGILNVKDTSKNFIWESNRDILNLAFNDKENRILILDDVGKVRLLSVYHQKGNLSATDLKNGKGLPHLEPLEAMRYDLFDPAQINDMPKADQYSLLQGLRGLNVPARYRASFDSTRDKLLINYISTSEVRGPSSQDSTVALELSKRINILRWILEVTEPELNAGTKIKSLNLFKETLVEGQLSPLSEWLLLASASVSKNDLGEKRWLAGKAYQIFPDPAWKSMMEDNRGKYFIETSNVSPLDTFVMGLDVNSVDFAENSTKMFVTTDVDSLLEARGGYYFDISEDGLQLDLLWKIPKGAYENSTIVWDGDISPSGRRAMTLDENGKTKIWDLEAQRLIGSIDLKRPCRVCRFVDDSRALVGNQKGIMLLEISRNGEIDTTSIYQTGNYHGDLNSLLVLPNEVWMAGFSSGAILTNSLIEDNEFEMQLPELGGEFLDMEYDARNKVVLISQQNLIYSIEVDEEYMLQEPSLKTVVISNSLNGLYGVDNFEEEALMIWAGLGGDIGVATSSKQYTLFKNESGEQFFDIATSSDGQYVAAANADDILYLFSRQQLREIMVDWVAESSNTALSQEKIQGIRNELSIQLGDEWAEEVWEHITSR